MLVDECGEVELVGPVSAKLVGRRSLGFRSMPETVAGGRRVSQGLTQHVWWLASRASGVVALGLVTISVAPRTDHGRQALTQAGSRAGLERDPRADCDDRPGGHRRARPHPARRPLAQPRAGRDRDSLHHRLQDLLGGPRDHRRLPRGATRPELLRAPPNRSSPLEAGPQGDDPRLRPGRGPHARRRHGCLESMVVLAGGRQHPRRRRVVPRSGGPGDSQRPRRARSAADRRDTARERSRELPPDVEIPPRHRRRELEEPAVA